MRLSTTSFAQGEEGSSDGRGHSDTELSSKAEGDYKFEQDLAPPPAPNTPGPSTSNSGGDITSISSSKEEVIRTHESQSQLAVAI